MPARQQSAPPQRLSTLLRTLGDRGYQCRDLTYRKLWEDAIRGRYPAHQITGRWHFLLADVPAIAAAYSLTHLNTAA